MPSKVKPAVKPARTSKREAKAPRSRARGEASRSPEAIARVRELAWAGQQERAIELASQALANLAGGRADSRAKSEMDLLDLRAESFIAVGKLELAAKDAHEMVRLANREKSAKLKAQALNRRAVVEMRRGDLKSALKTAASGLRAAKQSKQKALMAESYFRLSEAQVRTGQNESALETAQEAINLFLELGDNSGMGRAYWSLALAHDDLGHAEDSRRAAQTSLELCKQAGDQYGVGNALNIVSWSDLDIAERIGHLQQAFQAFELAGYVERQQAALTNLADAYSNLGLYSHARRLASETVEMNPRIGGKEGAYYSLKNVFLAELLLGSLDAARAHLGELSELAQGLDEPRAEVDFAQNRGYLALFEGDPKAAVRLHKSALRLAHQAGLVNEEVRALAFLGSMYLASGDDLAGLKATTKAMKAHLTQSTQKDPYVLWFHVRALLANQKTEEARLALEQAHDSLLEGMASLRDEGLRRNYLNKVALNRELIQYWVKDGLKRRLPKERIFAHLAIESNVREPFGRLADVGLRLNALKSIAEIQTFLVEEATELIGGERVMLVLERDGKRQVTESVLPVTSFISGKGVKVAEDPQKVLASIHTHLDQARLRRTAQLTLPARKGLNRIIAPLIVQNQILGYLYVDMDTIYGRFDETDRDMLGMLANQGAVALDNAQWAQGLEQKVEERTEELRARVDELAIINSVQAALAAKLDLQGIYNLIGDKIQEIFDAQSVLIGIYDHATRLRSFPYNWEKGEYHPVVGSRPFNKLAERLIATKEPILINQFTEGIGAKLGLSINPGTEPMKSGVFVPLIAGNMVTGVISLQNIDRENAFSDSDVRLLQTLANSMSVALQNAQSFKAEQERVAELQIINSIQQGLAAELDFQAIVDLVGEKLREVFHTGDLGIDWYDESAKLVHYLYLYEHGKRLTIPSRPPTPNGILDQQIRTHKPIVFNSPADYERLSAIAIPGTDQGKSFVSVPIISSDRVLGAIGIEDFERENAFGDSELRLLTTIAASLGTALENARLFDETQRLLKETEQRNAELAIINSVQAGLAAQLDMQAIYDLVGDQLRDTFTGHTITIYTYEPRTDLLHCSYMTTRSGARLTPEPFPLSKGGFAAHVIHTRQPLFIDADMERHQEEYGSWVVAGGETSRSGIWVPLMIGEEARGVVSVQNLDREHAFGDSDFRLLTTLASTMSVALENARLFKAEQERVAELQIINSIQQGLAAELDFQAIVDLVGDKLREVFRTPDLGVRWYDEKTNLVHFLYAYEHGKRLQIAPVPPAPGGTFEQFLRDRQPIIGNTAEFAARTGGSVVPGTDLSKSIISVPIITSDRLIGSLQMEDYERENAYGESELRLLTTIAASLGTALENARLFDETQRLLRETEQRNAELAIINSVQAALAAELSIQGIYDAVGDKIRQIFHNFDVAICIYDPGTNLLNYPYLFEGGQRLSVDSIPLPEIGKGMSAHVIRNRQTLVINANMTQEMQKYGSFVLPGTQQEKSHVRVPLVTGEQARGYISLSNMEREDAFSDSDVRLLQTLANAMSVALENARLFDETQRLLKETEQRAAELAIINSVQEGLASKLDMQAIYDLVGDKIREIFDAQVVGIVAFDKASNLAHFPYAVEKGNRWTIEARPPSGISGLILRTGKPVMITENLAQREQALLGEVNQPIAGEEIKSRLDVPMIVGGEVKGVISLQNVDREGAFAESDLRLLTTLANSMSVALENARLFDETQRLLKITEERAEELAIINSVQAGLASQLDIQAIFDLVGDKIRDTFDGQGVAICTYDRKTNMLHYPYLQQRGQRRTQEPLPLSDKGFGPLVMRTRQPLMVNEKMAERSAEVGSFILGGGEAAMSGIWVPLVMGGEERGWISIQNVDRENAFSDSDLRLLTTLASSLSVAFENARLFDETQRLLKITEERAEELAIINSVQAGLASQLDIQAIFDLVGDKVRDTFDAQAVMINTYDRATNLLHYPYIIERGQRQKQEPISLADQGFGPLAMRTRQPIMVNANLVERAEKVGAFVVGGGEMAKSGIWVPLVIGGEARGVISIQNLDRENAFSDSDFRLLTTLASSLSVAFENARLFDETQRLLKITEERAEELAIINSVQAGLSSQLDIQAIFDLVGDKIRDTFDAQSVGIYTYDRQTRMLHFPYIYEKGRRISEEPRKLGKSFSARVMRTRKPLMINEKMSERTAELSGKPIGGTEAPKSGIWVPLVIGNEARGVISIQNVDREHAFRDSDFRLLTTLASSLSVAFENARLFSETQRLLKETEQRNAELAIINKVQQGLASKLEMQAIYDLVGDEVRSIFDAQSVLIVTYDKQANLFHYPYNIEKGERYHVDPTPPMGVSEQMIKTRQPVLIRNDFPQHYQELTGRSLVHFAGEEPKSWLGVPLLVGNEVRGTISLQNVDREEAYSDSDLRLLSTLAGTMSVALENARLFDETQRLLKETEQRAAELAIINSVQEGLASKLEMQLIYDLVGDKICEIFNLQTCFIMIYDRETETENYPYIVEDGQRMMQEPLAHDENGFGPLVMRTRQPIMINTGMEERSAEVGSYLLGGGSLNPKSAIYVPLLIGNEPKGVISVQNNQRENAFSESDLRLLTTLASSMSVALESARLFAETEQRAAQLAIINSVQQGLASKLDIQAIYELVGEKLRELFDMQAISLVSFDLENNTYHYQYLLEKGQRLDIPDATITPMGELIIRTRKTLLVNERVEENLAKLGVAMKIIPGTEPTKALLRVPILIGGRVSGFIGLSNLEKENAFSESDVRLLETLASSLSVALESARLFEETKRNAAELATVNMVSSALASELDIRMLIQLVGEQIRTIFRAEIAYVALLDEERETITFPYQYGEVVAPMHYGEGLTSKIIETAKPLLINTEVNREVRHIGATYVGMDVQSYLGVPIMVGGRAVGVVSVQSTSHEDAFDENDQRLLGTIAANVGSALHNAQLYKEAQESRAAAEQANRAKSTFLANMSHELRTPLNAIIGFTRIVRRKADGALPDKQLENLDKVLSSSEHLLGLINTVLDIAKIEAGRMDVIPANFNIAGLAETCANLTAPLLRPTVKLERHVDESLGMIYSDQDKIKQIVINLLSNAAKFTHEGKVVLSVNRRDEDTIDIAVADSGIGISEEALGRIFEEFQQADTSTTRQYGGTGLGLAISRSLARLLGGDLTATSELGKGSTFTLTLPIKFGTKEISTATPSREVDRRVETPVEGKEVRKTVLVIDDDPDAVYLLQENLSQEEFNVIGTRSGNDGLQVAREEQPDAILLDILMPEVDGWQVLNDLKEDPATTAIPVILLTIVDKKALGFRLGAAAYLLKPLDPAAVLETLRRVIGDKGQARKHALVVDDDPNVAEMLGQILTEPEFELESAVDGEAGLQAIAARRPDIILLDLIMPKLDGFGVIEKLRADPGTRDIPIIVISAKELTEEESKKLRATVAFVMKKQGFDSQRLMQELTEAMHG